ncbi:MAG: cell wall hydrolase [Clostridia bacterium]|nr:cell wall hydrolase [Clostridia bacterium]
MKKLILTLVFLFVFGTFFVPTQAKSEFFTPVCLSVNGKYVKTTNHAYLKNETTMVSLRDLGEIFNADIQWSEKTSTATVKTDTKTISVEKDKNYATVNGKSQKLDSTAVIANDRVYVPLRFLAENLGAKVSWDSATICANITSPEASVPAHLAGEAPYSADELYWLSKIVSAESAGEINSGKVAVANVILNRVKSPEFPNTIYGVIFDKKYGVQFAPTADGAIYNTPTSESVTAAKRALLGEDVSRQCLYFLNPKTATNSWIVKNRKFYKTIGNHDFYL